MTFEQTLPHLRNGLSAKLGDKAIYIVPAANYPAATNAAKQLFPSGVVPYTTYFACATAFGSVKMWQPTADELLSDEWGLMG